MTDDEQKTSIMTDINVLFLFCPKNKCQICLKKFVCLFLRSQLKNLVVPAAKSLLPLDSRMNYEIGTM